MADLHIDRLALSLPGFSADEGRRLARLITDGLAAAPFEAAGSLASVRVEVSGGPRESLDRLADQVVAEVRRQLA
jgi:hypothetical protein